ncbi:MAG: ABC transporter permease [Lentisphaerae bacterium]|nr:ABC transporter permease [Lentisphaerota bacterium]MCP4102514.1 ABC transporter permease [Lentisphaerota bacterium]
MRDANGHIGKVSSLFKRLAADKIALLCMILVGAYLVTAFSVEIYSWVCAHNGVQPAYNYGNIDLRYQPPSFKHLLGTDFMGRDVLLRAVAGTSTAIKVGAMASFISALIGVTLGAIAGYFGGKFDDFVVWLYSTFASMPTLLFILAFALLVSKGFLSPSLIKLFAGFAALFNADPGMMAVYLAIGITGWVTLCRVVRAETLKLRETPYVQAAKVTGISSTGIIIRHILPNLFHLVIIYFTIRFAYAIMTEVIVSYLGFGVQLSPSWGVMISQGQDGIWRGIWWEVAAATIFMFFLVLPLHLLGDALRDTLDPRLRQ